jgi:hypothetical protein
MGRDVFYLVHLKFIEEEPMVRIQLLDRAAPVEGRILYFCGADYQSNGIL